MRPELEYFTRLSFVFVRMTVFFGYFSWY